MVEMSLKPRQVEILQVALRLLAEGGCHALTIRNIAFELGITEPAIYRHFGSKKDLLMALYGYVWARLKDEVLPVLDAGGDPPQRLSRVVESTLSFLSKNKGVNLVLLSEAIHHNDPDLKGAMLELITNFQKRLKEVLAEGMREGFFKDDLDLEVASRAVMGFVQSTVIFSLLKGEEREAGREASGFVRVFLRGVGR